MSYTTNSTNATDSLSYTKENADATVVQKLNGSTFTGSTVTWTNNTDTLTLVVTSGSLTKTYTVTCTHTS